MEVRRHTPRLDIHSNKRFGGDLRLSSLLLLVGSKTLLTDPDGLGVLLLVTAEQIDIIVILLGGRRLGGIQSSLRSIRSVDSVRLGGVTGKSGELLLERGDVLVPSRSVGVLGGIRGRAEGLENGNIGLRRRVANTLLAVVQLLVYPYIEN